MRTALRYVAFALISALPLSAQAHKAWLLPSDTVLSSEKAWITVDAAVSNDLFYFNHVPLRPDALSVTAPDGSAVSPQNTHTGQLRSVFDLELSTPGTYRIALASKGLFASWEEGGEPRRWRGRAEDFASQVPTAADKLQVTQAQNRVETFVTLGRPSRESIAPAAQGLSLEFVGHPNDLMVGDTAEFRLLLDGAPAADVAVEVVNGGTRYRDDQQAMTLRTDDNGAFAVTWPSAGMYWLQASASDAKAAAPATQRRASYVVTLEVLP
ncbi:DUF4198 domain-containing protein [Aquimonas voraii]|uniref:Uncharacterized conserved protein, contains GH25 family domain n=1 Tax=Aquimonas voraii TaxID=265719 RepID=A0A1G6YD06_9GAMM|nr:DUF4198 domain-containing protein [Aquimonas voraii]SDD88258.1 Uncharacterized conserved protein, contains GH25 family domain [Aquimonas voraii]